METKSNNPEEITLNALGNRAQNTKPLPIKTINDAESTSQIHFDGNTTFYALSEHEFKTIKNGVDNYWKELCIATWSLFFPFLINSITEGNQLKWISSNWEFFFNSLFALTTLVLSIVFSFAWYNSNNYVKEIFEDVESKPKFKL